MEKKQQVIIERKIVVGGWQEARTRQQAVIIDGGHRAVAGLRSFVCRRERGDTQTELSADGAGNGTSPEFITLTAGPVIDEDINLNIVRGANRRARQVVIFG